MLAAMHESAIGTKRTSRVALHMSAFGGEADIIQGKVDIKKCPLMTQSGHRQTKFAAPISRLPLVAKC